MKTDVKVIAGLLASIIWADGEYDAAEKVTLEEIVDALELDAATFNKAIEAELEVVRNKSEEDLNIYINEISEKVADEEIGIVYEAAIQLVVCDGVMSLEEVELLHAIAEALGISASMATVLIADMVTTEPELEVSFGE